MNILQINTHDIQGGAAKVAYDLHKTYKAMGYNAKMLVGLKRSNDPDVIQIRKYRSSGLRKLYEKISYWADYLEGVSHLQYFLCTPARYLYGIDAFKAADVIHMHNPHGGYINFWALEKLSRVKPLIWTLHDMWGLTGFCFHSLDCEKWRTGCGECRLITGPADTTHYLWKVKSKIYKKSDFIVTTPSLWLKNKLAEGILAGIPAYLVPNAVNTQIFAPKDKLSVRRELGLPLDRFIVTFTADWGKTNPFKGFNYLIEALSILKDSYKYNPYLVMIGDSRSSDEIKLEGFNAGVIRNPEVIAKYNNASDVYLVPSIAENSPLVVLEALSCGTPVVAFDVGGIPEIVKHKVTGYIAKYKAPEDFALGIKWLLDLPKERCAEMSRDCTSFINERHTLELQVRNFLMLYEEAIRRKGKVSSH